MVAYMALEVLDFGWPEARSHDLEQNRYILALGVVILCVMNADIPFPYKYELEKNCPFTAYLTPQRAKSGTSF